MSVSVGEVGLEEIREAKEGVTGLGEEWRGQVEGAGMGMGCKETSVTGSHCSEVTISQYLSFSYRDKDWKMGLNMGKSTLRER